MDLATAYRRVQNVMIDNDAAPVKVFLAEVNAELMRIAEEHNEDEAAAALARENAPETVAIEDREFGGWDYNVYSSPEKCGLTLLGVAEKEPNYDFDMVLLLKDKGSDRFFMVHDSGCSCPTPFEDVRSVSDLTEVKTRGEAQRFLTTSNPTYDGFTDTSLMQMLKAISDNLERW